MYTCKYFNISELVHPSLLAKYGEDKCWMFFDDRLLKYVDYLRDKYGPINVNYAGMTNCGARPMDTTTGASMSAHKIFRALDCHIMSIENKYTNKKDKALAYKEIRNELLKESEWSFINFEMTVSGEPISWLHIDTYNRKKREFTA